MCQVTLCWGNLLSRLENLKIERCLFSILCQIKHVCRDSQFFASLLHFTINVSGGTKVESKDESLYVELMRKCKLRLKEIAKCNRPLLRVTVLDDV
jgi:hypothetical protein